MYLLQKIFPGKIIFQKEKKIPISAYNLLPMQNSRKKL